MRLRTYNEQTDFVHIKNWILDERTHALWCANLLSYPLSKEGLHKYLAEQIPNNKKEYDGAYVYVNEDDCPVGFLIYSVNEQDKSGFVRFIMVDNTSRGKGYGTAMLKELQRFAYDRTGVTSIRLNVFDVNAAAGKCYEKAGFHVISNTPDAFSYRDETWGRCMMEHREVKEVKQMKKEAVNPYLPSWEYIPDGEPYVFGDRVYVYGSHDYYNGHVFCLGDYVCWSAPTDDLGNWRYEGVIYRKTDDPLNREGKMCLYAPDVTVGPDGRYYLYYVLDKVSIVSVAVCDTPAGKYSFYGYVHYPDGTRLGEREGDEPQFDPGVLTEGKDTWLYTGFCSPGDKSRTGAMATLLDEDMLTVKEAPRCVAPGCEYSTGTEYEGHAFYEAPSIRKRGDTYYFIYSSQVMHELCYAVSDKPYADFSYGGVIVSNCDLHIDSYKPADLPMAYGANNHGSIVEIEGKWYIFYHRHTNGTWYSRQGCAEEIHFSEDGSISQVEMTSCGLNGGPLEGEGEHPAYLACNLFTSQPSVYVGDDRFPKIVQEGRDGDEEDGYIVNIKDSATAGFKYFICKNIKKCSVTTRGYAEGTFEFRTKWDGEVIAKIQVENSNVWETYTTDIGLADGIYAFYITYTGSGIASLKSFALL